MSDRHDVLSAEYWSARARHMRDLTVSTQDHTSRAAYLRLMHMYEGLAKLSRADRPAGGSTARASVPLLTRRRPTTNGR